MDIDTIIENENAVVTAIKKTITKVHHVDELPPISEIGNVKVEEVSTADLDDQQLDDLESGEVLAPEDIEDNDE
jgi:hypothetical protein